MQSYLEIERDLQVTKQQLDSSELSRGRLVEQLERSTKTLKTTTKLLEAAKLELESKDVRIQYLESRAGGKKRDTTGLVIVVGCILCSLAIIFGISKLLIELAVK